MRMNGASAKQVLFDSLDEGGDAPAPAPRSAGSGGRTLLSHLQDAIDATSDGDGGTDEAPAPAPAPGRRRRQRVTEEPVPKPATNPTIRLSPSALARAGKIIPSWQPPGYDRPAFYTLAGKYYDAFGRLIEAGKPLDPNAEEVVEAEETPTDKYGSAEGDLPIGTLIALAPTMPLEELRAAAGRIIGPERLHRSREQIIWQLKAVKNTTPHIDWGDFERGGGKTNLVTVRRFIAARFGQVITSRRQALAILRDEGIIGMPPAKPAKRAAGGPSPAKAEEDADA